MAETDALDERLSTLERALTGSEHDIAGLEDAAALATRLEDLDSRLDAVESQLADLEASTQALRGYVGNVRSVNEDVRDTADAALTKVDELDEKLDKDSAQAERGHPSAGEAERGQPSAGKGPSSADQPVAPGSQSSGGDGLTSSDAPANSTDAETEGGEASVRSAVERLAASTDVSPGLSGDGAASAGRNTHTADDGHRSRDRRGSTTGRRSRSRRDNPTGVDASDDATRQRCECGRLVESGTHSGGTDESTATASTRSLTDPRDARRSLDDDDGGLLAGLRSSLG
jgi:uncharacterized coiled-coil protein SlyX